MWVFSANEDSFSLQDEKILGGKSPGFVSVAFSARSDTRGLRTEDRGLPTDNRLLQIRHFDRRHGRFEALVAHLQSSSIDRLLQRVAGENAECMWNASFLRGLSNAAPALVHNHVVVSSVPAKQATEADDRIVLPGFGQGAGSRGDFEGAGNTNDIDVFFGRA